MREFKDGKLKTPNGEVVTDKNQALAVLLTKLSSARDNPLEAKAYVDEHNLFYEEPKYVE